MLQVSTDGVVSMLTTLVDNWGSIHAGLYVSAHIPLYSDTLAVYQAMEATFPGYARQPLVNWLVPGPDAEGNAVTFADLLTWRQTAPAVVQDVYGVFMVSPAGDLLWAEVNPNGSTPMQFAGDTFSHFPQFALGASVFS